MPNSASEGLRAALLGHDVLPHRPTVADRQHAASGATVVRFFSHRWAVVAGGPGRSGLPW